MHLKRTEMPKIWAVKRKGTKYIVRASHNLRNSLPLLVLLRDILKVARTRKEIKNLLKSGKIKINKKAIKEDNFPLCLLDLVELDNKSFRIVLKNRKLGVEEAKNTEEKIAKVIGKKVLKKGKLQINLSDGRNYLFNKKVRTGDSVVIDLKENKIKEILEFKEGCDVLFIKGKHLSQFGKVEKIEKGKMIIVKIGNEEINSKMENLLVIK